MDQEWGDFALMPVDGHEDWAVASAETSADMGALIAACNIPQALYDDLLVFTPEEFGLIAVSLEDLDSWIKALALPVDVNRSLVVARLRLLWKKCQSSVASPASVTHIAL